MRYEEFREKFSLPAFNEQQETAMKAVDGATLLLAVPGSGKTTVLVHRVGYMIHVAGIDPRNILTLTYTKNAANEMANRFFAKFEAKPQFSTINSFCLSVLKVCAREKGEQIPALITNTESVCRNLMYTTTGEWPSDMAVRQMAALIGRSKNEMWDDRRREAESTGEVKSFNSVYNAYQKHLFNTFQMDFDDQLIFAYDLLQKYPDILQRTRVYKYVSVDEAQDTSLIQHKIIQMLVGKTGNIFMVGDEDQSIYGFRGAYPQALLEFESTYSNAKTLLMETNYRSDKKIVAATNQFIKRNAMRHDKNMTANHLEDGKITISPQKTMQKCVDEAVKRIIKAIGDGESIALLSRNNETLLPVRTKLKKLDLEVTALGSISMYFTHAIVSDLLDMLRFIVEPGNIELFSRFYYKLGLWIKKQDILAFTEGFAGKSVLDAMAISPNFHVASRRIGVLRKVFQKCAESDPAKAISILVDSSASGYGDWIDKKVSEGSSEQSLLLKAYILRLIASEYKTIPEFLSAVDEMREADRKMSSNNVFLSTIHGSKGMEFDNVIILDPIDGILPSTNGRSSKEEIEEDARLFYVACTRAKHKLEFLYPESVYSLPLEPSEYLKDFGKKFE